MCVIPKSNLFNGFKASRVFSIALKAGMASGGQLPPPPPPAMVLVLFDFVVLLVSTVMYGDDDNTPTPSW